MIGIQFIIYVIECTTGASVRCCSLNPPVEEGCGYSIHPPIVLYFLSLEAQNADYFVALLNTEAKWNRF